MAEGEEHTEYATKDDVHDIVTERLEPFKALLEGEDLDEPTGGAGEDPGDGGDRPATLREVEELFERKVKSALAPLKAKAAKKAPPKPAAPKPESEPVAPAKRRLTEWLWG